MENYKAQLERLGMSGERVNKEARRIKNKGRKGRGGFENQTDLLEIKNCSQRTEKIDGQVKERRVHSWRLKEGIKSSEVH